MNAGENLIYASRYPTLQLAINDAPAGAIVILSPKTYTETITINKALKLMGGPGSIIIGAVSVTASDVSLERLTIQNGSLTVDGGLVKFACIGIYFNNSVTVLQNTAGTSFDFLFDWCRWQNNTTVGATLISILNGIFSDSAFTNCRIFLGAAGQTAMSTAIYLTRVRVERCQFRSDFTDGKLIDWQAVIDNDCVIAHNHLRYVGAAAGATTVPLITLGNVAGGFYGALIGNRISMVNGNNAGANPSLLIRLTYNARIIGNEFDTVGPVRIVEGDPAQTTRRTCVISGNSFIDVGAGGPVIDASTVNNPRMSISGNTVIFNTFPSVTFLAIPITNHMTVTGNNLATGQVISTNPPTAALGNVN